VRATIVAPQTKVNMVNNMLTTQLVTSAQSPAWIKTYVGKDIDANEETRYKIQLTEMKDGDSFTVRVSGNPSLDWQEYDGDFGTSVLAFFETEDGLKLSCFIRTGTSYQKTKGLGKSLYQRLCEFADQDVISVTLHTRDSKTKGRQPTKIYVVEPSDFQ